MSEPAISFRVGLIGTGRISGIDMKNCATFEGIDMVARGSLNPEASRARAVQHGIPGVCSPDTFPGGRWRAARNPIDQGVIGPPTGMPAFVPMQGTERHSPNPELYCQTGSGPRHATMMPVEMLPKGATPPD